MSDTGERQKGDDRKARDGDDRATDGRHPKPRACETKSDNACDACDRRDMQSKTHHGFPPILRTGDIQYQKQQCWNRDQSCDGRVNEAGAEAPGLRIGASEAGTQGTRADGPATDVGDSGLGIIFMSSSRSVVFVLNSVLLTLRTLHPLEGLARKRHEPDWPQRGAKSRKTRTGLLAPSAPLCGHPVASVWFRRSRSVTSVTMFQDRTFQNVESSVHGTDDGGIGR